MRATHECVCRACVMVTPARYASEEDATRKRECLRMEGTHARKKALPLPGSSLTSDPAAVTSTAVSGDTPVLVERGNPHYKEKPQSHGRQP